MTDRLEGELRDWLAHGPRGTSGLTSGLSRTLVPSVRVPAQRTMALSGSGRGPAFWRVDCLVSVGKHSRNAGAASGGWVRSGQRLHLAAPFR